MRSCKACRHGLCGCILGVCAKQLLVSAVLVDQCLYDASQEIGYLHLILMQRFCALVFYYGASGFPWVTHNFAKILETVLNFAN